MKPWQILDDVTDAVLAASLAAVSVIITINVIMRYVFNASLSWSTELSGGLLVWITFLGAYRCSREQTHLSISLLSEHCSPRTRHRVAIARSLIQCAFFVMLGYLSLRVTQLVGGSHMQTIEWPVGIWFSGICVGFFLLTLSEARDLVTLIKQRPTPPNDQASRLDI
ncbi:TRAP transporter small permease [Allopusillimonas ginsengisoli]|uniref:TRAP transporter small permease n=1 Tax=Allopusillimonas ginsengisoli TaxID=453575 RepID=UPI00101FF660|nr:TRAP transporter small permease [Allopusillimonas ginsengisoli]TEA79998.1 TRAP transporter small permease [Allopusillimonas ginsengisoli]